MVKHKHVVNLSEVPSDAISAPPASPFGGVRQRVGTAVGGQKLGYSFFRVPPGKTAFPFHQHHGNEEMIYIIDGDARLRLGKEELPVSSGTIIACPAGPDYPHQLINTSTKELHYLVVSTMEYPDISEYPDSNKIGAYTTTSAAAKPAGFRALYFKDNNVSYYEAEDAREVERVKRSAPKA